MGVPSIRLCPPHQQYRTLLRPVLDALQRTLDKPRGLAGHPRQIRHTGVAPRRRTQTSVRTTPENCHTSPNVAELFQFPAPPPGAVLRREHNFAPQTVYQPALPGCLCGNRCGYLNDLEGHGLVASSMPAASCQYTFRMGYRAAPHRAAAMFGFLCVHRHDLPHRTGGLMKAAHLLPCGRRCTSRPAAAGRGHMQGCFLVAKGFWDTPFRAIFSLIFWKSLTSCVKSGYNTTKDCFNAIQSTRNGGIAMTDFGKIKGPMTSSGLQIPARCAGNGVSTDALRLSTATPSSSCGRPSAWPACWN